MRRWFGIALICLLFVTLCFSGCDDLGTKPDSVTVNVMAAVYVRFVDEQNHEVTMSPDSIRVSVEMTKDGHDRLVFSRIVQQGLCQATASYTMTKGQSIACTATIEESFMGYTMASPATAYLSWATVNASVNFGGLYHWYPEMTITMKK